MLYLAYIRLFCNLPYNQISFKENSRDDDYIFAGMGIPICLNCIIVGDKNDEERKDYPNLNQTFQVEFNELLLFRLH